MVVRSVQGDTLDSLCWKYLGTTKGVVEKALQLNHGIAGMGETIPEGMDITLPNPTTVRPKDTSIKLWD